MSPSKGWEHLRAKVPNHPKGEQERVHNLNLNLLMYTICCLITIQDVITIEAWHLDSKLDTDTLSMYGWF